MSSSKTAASIGAPSHSSFHKVLRDPCTTHEDIGAEKQAVMRWCLSEAKLDMERDFAKRAKSVMFSQDASKGKLLLRVSVSNELLENQRFTISLMNLTGTDSFAVRDTTELAINRWATPRLDVPAWGCQRSPTHKKDAEIDLEAKDRLCMAIQGIATDAASDELRAMRLASGASASSFVDKVLFPNVVLHGKDPTHASGRFLKVWQNDPYLNSVFDLLVWGPDSMAQLIEHSPDISRRFAERVQLLEALGFTVCVQCFYHIGKIADIVQSRRPCPQRLISNPRATSGGQIQSGFHVVVFVQLLSDLVP